MKTTLIALLCIIVVFLTSCTSDSLTFHGVEDCAKIKDSIKRDECYADFAVKFSSRNLELGLSTCNEIKDTIIQDGCYLNIFEQKTGLISNDELRKICERINNIELRDNCNRKIGRPHLRGFVK